MAVIGGGAFMAEAFTAVVDFAAADLDEEALTVEDLDAEASAVTAGSMVEAASAAAQAAGFTVVVDSAAADTAKLSSAENQPTIQTAGGICLRPFFVSLS